METTDAGSLTSAFAKGGRGSVVAAARSQEKRQRRPVLVMLAVLLSGVRQETHRDEGDQARGAPFPSHRAAPATPGVSAELCRPGRERIFPRTPRCRSPGSFAPGVCATRTPRGSSWPRSPEALPACMPRPSRRVLLPPISCFAKEYLRTMRIVPQFSVSLENMLSKPSTCPIVRSTTVETLSLSWIPDIAAPVRSKTWFTCARNSMGHVTPVGTITRLYF